MLKFWQTTRFRIELSRVRLMGIVNVTPDSFSDGGRYSEPRAALAHCERLIEEGADILDIGGESTRPGATAPGEQEECDRVLPVLQAAIRLGVPVSVDTSSPLVIGEALKLGVDIINDVRALSRPGALKAIAVHPAVGICLMHSHGGPATMQAPQDSVDGVADVADFLERRARDLEVAGVHHDRIVVDPGIGFSKGDAANLALLARQRELQRGWPLLVGWSRKRTLGHLTGRGVEDRLVASVTAALLAAQGGAAVLRVHDVAATADALKVWEATRLSAA